MEPILLIIIIIFIVIILSIIIYYVSRYLKGTLELRIDKTPLIYGSNVNGTLKIKAKKQIQSNRLFVALVKEEYQKRGKNSSWIEVSRQEQTLEEARNYLMNFSNVYSFQIPIPAVQVMENNIQNNILKGFSSLFKKRIRWKIIARLDAEGVDLYTSKIISINEPISNQNQFNTQTLQN